MTTITWSQIEAECGNYRAGFVATFRKYEGQETDERTSQNKIVKVTVASFARRILGISDTAFQRWIDAEEGKPRVAYPSQTAASAAGRFARQLPPEEQANLIRDLLNDNPEVTEQFVADPQTRHTLRAASDQAAARHYEDEQGRTARKRAADPIGRGMDKNIALLDLQKAINRFVNEARELLPEIGIVPPGERHWLAGEADRLDAVTAEVRYLADHGETRTDAELRTLTGQ